MTEYLVYRFRVLGTRMTVYAVYEPTYNGADHGTVTTFHGRWYGRVGTRRIPPEIQALPLGEERTRAVEAHYSQQYELAYQVILRAFPEAADGEREAGEIVVVAATGAAETTALKAVQGGKR
jgi:hypothetical protein